MGGQRGFPAGGSPEKNRDRQRMCRYQELGMSRPVVYFIVDSAGKYLRSSSTHNLIVVFFEYRILNRYQLKGSPCSGAGDFVNITFEFN